MKLFTYGDSWTEGQGANTYEEDKINSREERKKYRNDRSWPNKLSKLLNCEHLNQSISGVGNNFIFNAIISDIKSNLIKSSDFIIIMWSSSLRDDVSFFPKNEWHVWGENYITPIHKNKWFVSNESTLTKNPNYNEFLIKFKEFYIDELYTQSYYNTINQNYILFIQKLCEHYGIKYLFCDAFDKMIDNVYQYNDKTNNINKINYWNFGIKTFKDFLIETNNNMVWESPKSSIFKTPGMHPSELGYKIIAEELYKHIKNNNILNTKSNNISLKFI